MHEDFYGIHFGAFGGHSSLNISKATNLNLSQNSPPSHLAMPCHTAKLGYVQNIHNSKLFVHQDFRGNHLGKFGGHSNSHISKTTNFIFSQNCTPGHLSMPCHTAKHGRVQHPQNSKLLCTKTFMVFI